MIITELHPPQDDYQPMYCVGILFHIWNFFFLILLALCVCLKLIKFARAIPVTLFS